jgi:hypothetical protein
MSGNFAISQQKLWRNILPAISLKPDGNENLSSVMLQHEFAGSLKICSP